MDDSISRKAAIDEIRKCRFVVDAIEKIRGLPSAEPKTGEWIRDGYDFPHGNDWIHCSVCGKRGINVPADLTNFCPNCGSKMVREDGEA